MNKIPASEPAGMVRMGATRIELDDAAYARVLAAVPSVADEAVTTIMAEVPAYAGAFSGDLGVRIRDAVRLALVGFLDLTRRGSSKDPAVPIAASTEGAYELGRGEARSGRGMDALLAAYRIGARVSWRGLSRAAVAAGVSAEDMGGFADLVFTYIDALSAASIAGHSDERGLSGHARGRYLERLARMLVAGESDEALVGAVERAEWVAPRSLTAVLLPEGQVTAVLGLLDARTLHATGDLPAIDADDVAVLLVPDVRGADRGRLVDLLQGRDAIVGPARPWTEAAQSYQRVVRARGLPRPQRRATIDTDTRLVEIVLLADESALADLKATALAPFESLRPAVRTRLVETLRAWLLFHGRRELVARALFVHPQTVRYRMTRLRELFGSRLDDPEEVLRLTLALAVAPRPEAADVPAAGRPLS
ncbi:MAG: helix-turn-helix domain-containing protein [Dermatophilaceae bacterium]